MRTPYVRTATLNADVAASYNKWFSMTLTVPPGSTGTVFIPAPAPEAVQEGGRALAKTPGVRWLRQEGDRAVVEVGSGTWRFRSRSRE